ncbi:hypothetical protein CK203_045609 [Vitis vinifera]|uniref:Putative plant transposon protein domain-containing protein n=1 Tax=Vitis vinifera TaxID=29760 RepID=A0A438HQ63_VITVI|nr:hypothetical protein CK203_045609 [Vitis vinifera]
MHSEFEMGMMGELNFFLGLQIKQLKEGTFINQAKYIRDLLKRFNMEESKTMKIPMSSSIKLDKDEKGARLKVRFDIALFNIMENYQRYKQKFTQKKEPIFSTLVRAFYSRATYGLGGPIISIVRGVEIQLDPESICRIFDIAPVGLKVYESKAWPIVPGFEPREAIQRMWELEDTHEMGKPSAYSLTVISGVLHHMICSIPLPRGGQRYEVSYLEVFLMDSILTGRQIHVGYLIMMHMISCCESTTRILPYNRFLTKVFKDARVDLSRETDYEAPNIYNTYDEQSLGLMKFEKAPDDSWIRRVEKPPKEPELDIPPLQSEGVQFEVTFPKPMMYDPTYTTRPSSQPSFIEPPPIETSPH